MNKILSLIGDINIRRGTSSDQLEKGGKVQSAKTTFASKEKAFTKD